ncbi:hypothetical protein DIPPA_28504 [Diplonema papillatum]|nr:hypothetical protein DIPPA_28504 [Diplonema papillatum]
MVTGVTIHFRERHGILGDRLTETGSVYRYTVAPENLMGSAICKLRQDLGLRDPAKVLLLQYDETKESARYTQTASSLPRSADGIVHVTFRREPSFG